jgi:hypothetical protein
MMKMMIRFLSVLSLFVALLSACNDQSLLTDVARPTQDVGEEPPAYQPTDDLVSAPTTIKQTPLPGPTITEAVLIGPCAYPTPANQVTPWEQLIDRILIEDIPWETFQGTFQGSDKSTYWSYSFLYPAGWYPSDQQSLNQGYVQSIPPTQGQDVQGAFIKFEVVTLKDPPLINDGEMIDPQDFITMMIAGQPGVMRVNTQVPDQVRMVSAVFAYHGSWVAATGYINLPSANPASLEIWTTVIFKTLSTFEIQDQGG